MADAAGRVAAAVGLPVSPLTSARDVDDALVVETVPARELASAAAQRAAKAVAEVADLAGAGRVALVAAAHRFTELQESLAALGRAVSADPADGSAVDVGSDLVLLTPVQSKGLEFDVVVLLEPAEVLDDGPGDLYVAMTRPTQALHVVHARPLPAGLLPS